MSAEVGHLAVLLFTPRELRVLIDAVEPLEGTVVGRLRRKLLEAEAGKAPTIRLVAAPSKEARS